MWDRLPGVFVAAGPYAVDWWQREVVRGLVAALAIGLPATCMGTTFPVVLAMLAKRDDRGAQTGRVTAANTLASIVGSLVGGFVALPLLGSQRACGAVAIVYAAAALVVPVRRRWQVGAAAVATVALVALVPRWDLARLSSGTNVYLERQPQQGRVVWMDEDVHGGVVTVTENTGITTLWTNGKYQGDTGWQMTPQRSFADLPAAFAPRFGRALVVGLGTGVTHRGDGGKLPVRAHRRRGACRPASSKAARHVLRRRQRPRPRRSARARALRGRAQPAPRRRRVVRPRDDRAHEHLVRRGREPLQPRVLPGGSEQAERRGRPLAVDPAPSHDAPRGRQPDGHGPRRLRARGVLRPRAGGAGPERVAAAHARPGRGRPVDDLVLADDTLDAFVADVVRANGKRGRRPRAR